jgi:cell division protein FtsB
MYIHGTLAEKPTYDVYEKNTVLKRKKKVKKYRKSKIKAVFIIILLFISCMTLMYRYAILLNLNYTAGILEKQYTELKNENLLLKVELEKDTDIRYIKNEALERLGMKEPDRAQVVYLSIKKSDFTVVYNENEKKETIKENVFALLINKVGKLIRLFY